VPAGAIALRVFFGYFLSPQKVTEKEVMMSAIAPKCFV
jgi:hypothetical protein